MYAAEDSIGPQHLICLKRFSSENVKHFNTHSGIFKAIISTLLASNK